MSTTVISCFSCRNNLSFAGAVGFREECPSCKSDVRVCKNCEHYDPKIYNECKETQADRILEKERSNRCDFFRARTVTGSSASKSASDLKAAAEALFKKS